MASSKKSAVNHVVLTMILSDFLVISAPGLLSPIIAIFLTTQIIGGTLATVGFATTIFWTVKSVVQVPVAHYIDNRRGESDDFAFMIIGSCVASLVPLLYYMFATDVWHIYLFEIVNGIGYAFMVPTFLAIFTRHIDKFREGTEWTLHSNAVGIGFAAAAAIGGLMAERYGFRILFLLVSAVMFVGTVTLLSIRKDIIGGDRHKV